MRKLSATLCIFCLLMIPVAAVADGYGGCRGCGPCGGCYECGDCPQARPAEAVTPPSPHPDWVFLCTRGDGVQIYATRALQKKLGLRESDIRLNLYGLYVITKPSTGFINAKFYEKDLMLVQSVPYALRPDKVEIEIPAPFEQKCNRVLLF